ATLPLVVRRTPEGRAVEIGVLLAPRGLAALPFVELGAHHLVLPRIVRIVDPGEGKHPHRPGPRIVLPVPRQPGLRCLTQRQAHHRGPRRRGPEPRGVALRGPSAPGPAFRWRWFAVAVESPITMPLSTFGIVADTCRCAGSAGCAFTTPFRVTITSPSVATIFWSRSRCSRSCRTVSISSS